MFKLMYRRIKNSFSFQRRSVSYRTFIASQSEILGTEWLGVC